jgi:hypothetical protein
VDHSYDVHSIQENPVNDAVRAFDHFSHIIRLILRHDSTGSREFGDLLGAGGESIDDIAGVDG